MVLSMLCLISFTAAMFMLIAGLVRTIAGPIWRSVTNTKKHGHPMLVHWGITALLFIIAWHAM